MTALDGHDSVDFQEIQLGESGFSCAVRYQGKMGILEIHWWESDPIYRPNHGSFIDICHHLSILSFRVLPTLVKVWILSHPLAASWPKSPAQKIRRHLDTDIGRQAKHPSSGQFRHPTEFASFWFSKKDVRLQPNIKPKKLSHGILQRSAWTARGAGVGTLDTDSKLSVRMRMMRMMRMWGAPIHQPTPWSPTSPSSPRALKSSIQSGRWRRVGYGQRMTTGEVSFFSVRKQLWLSWSKLETCEQHFVFFSQEFDSFVSTMTWWMWVFWHSWLAAVYQAEQLLGGTSASLNISPFMAISMGNIGKHETTFRQTPKRMFGTQHGHPGQSSKIVKQHADKCLD